jgi:hypothetical protein
MQLPYLGTPTLKYHASAAGHSLFYPIYNPGVAHPARADVLDIIYRTGNPYVQSGVNLKLDLVTGNQFIIGISLDGCSNSAAELSIQLISPYVIYELSSR